MSIVATIKAATFVIKLVTSGIQVYREWQQRRQGRLDVMLELRLKRDKEKAVADEIKNRPMPSTDADILDGL